MANERRKSALACAAVIVLGSVLHASAQSPTNPADLTRAPIAATNANARILLAAKARPAAQKLRAQFSANIAATRVNLAEIDKSSVPVLVSARPSLVQSLRVFPKKDSYAASSHQGAMLIQINGTRVPVKAPERFRMPKTIKTMSLGQGVAAGDVLQDVRVDHSSSGVDVSFRRFGAVYNVSLDCGDAGESDPEAIGPAPGAKANAPSECTDDNALAIVKELEVIGGGAAQ